MYRDRFDAGRQLAKPFRGRDMYRPVVLAVPRGGVQTGAALARELAAELDVVLARKLRAPGQPECALGAVAESGEVYLCPAYEDYQRRYATELVAEREHQREEIDRRRELYRVVRPHSDLTGRTVIVTDDGIATGSTMVAALMSLTDKHAREVIVAVPVAAPDRLEDIRPWCDEIVCLDSPESFRSVGQYYQNFAQVEDAEVVELLRANSPSGSAAEG
ncbi:MAG: hypothetical protein K1X57_08915 [Gemmataceae bacterium]|nr:hypothetical protein [Gemmataceae bacterium]